MTNLKTDRFNLVAAGILAFSALASSSAHAALVSGVATITIDNAAMIAITGKFLFEKGAFSDQSVAAAPRYSI